MDGAKTIDSWKECYARYEVLKARDQWSTLAMAMIKLIDKIRSDAHFPPTQQFVSHAWLRIGPPSDEPTYRPTVWVGWRKPNYYWIGVGSFGTRNRITVSAEKVVPMLKRYLNNLALLDPTYPEYGETPVEPPADPWSKPAIETRYQTLPPEQVFPSLADDITHQARDIRGFVEQLHEAVNGIEKIAGADDALEAILSRLDRIADLVDAGSGRWRKTEAAPGHTLASRDDIPKSAHSSNGSGGSNGSNGNGSPHTGVLNGATVTLADLTGNGTAVPGLNIVTPNGSTPAANLRNDESA